MEYKNLTWEEIKNLHNQEWVERIDYDWPECEAHPRGGVVRVHAQTREEFDKLVAVDPPTESAFVFVGKPETPPNMYLSTFRVVEMS